MTSPMKGLAATALAGLVVTTGALVIHGKTSTPDAEEGAANPISLASAHVTPAPAPVDQTLTGPPPVPPALISPVPAPPPPPAPVQAKAADAVVDSIGVDADLSGAAGEQNLPLVTKRLAEAGIRHVRDSSANPPAAGATPARQAPGSVQVDTDRSAPTAPLPTAAAAEQAQAALPALYLERFRSGTHRTFAAALRTADPAGAAPTDLLQADGTPAPAYKSLAALTSLLSDPGPAGFTPGALPMTVTGGNDQTRSVLLQKRNGTFWLALWQQATDQTDPVAASPAGAGQSAREVTITLDQPTGAKVYTLDSPTVPIAISTSTSSVQLTSSAAVSVVELTPNPPATAPTPVAAATTATVNPTARSSAAPTVTPSAPAPTTTPQPSRVTFTAPSTAPPSAGAATVTPTARPSAAATVAPSATSPSAAPSSVVIFTAPSPAPPSPQPSSSTSRPTPSSVPSQPAAPVVVVAAPAPASSPAAASLQAAGAEASVSAPPTLTPASAEPTPTPAPTTPPAEPSSSPAAGPSGGPAADPSGSPAAEPSASTPAVLAAELSPQPIRTSGPAFVAPSPSAAPPVDAPSPSAPTDGGNPFAGARGFIDPGSDARRDADARRASDPAGARALDRIAAGSTADWYGEWVPTGDLARVVGDRVSTQTATGALPVLVTYAIPGRDCGSYSAGGAGDPQAYRDWIEQFAVGIADRKAVVIVEPDGLAQLDCLSGDKATERTELIRWAAQRLEQGAQTTVYLDAGTAGWKSPEEMAGRLTDAGVSATRGFAVNVSNFATTEASTAYGDDIARRLGGAPRYLIDTSRNGNGSDGTWCNPPGRKLGAALTTDTGSGQADALTWIKRVGESDGTCNGGPPAGTWWSEYAIALAQTP